MDVPWRNSVSPENETKLPDGNTLVLEIGLLHAGSDDKQRQTHS